MNDLAGKRIWVAGHQGMVGSALVRRLSGEGCTVLTVPRAELDLTDQAATRAWVEASRPDMVFIAAAKVGGILANSSLPVDFLYDNVMIAANVIEASHRAGVAKLMFLASSAVYPQFAEQPLRENSLLTGPLDPSHEPYAIAKIAGIKLCEAYRRQFGDAFMSVLPTNLYGEGDNFDLNSSHVLPALIRKAHEAKVSGADSLTIWGTGSPRREFLHADDCADACVHLMKTYDAPGHVNLGSGSDVTIWNLVHLVCDVVGFTGQILRDESKPDGTPRKLMAADTLLSLGWKPQIELRDGIDRTYRWFLANAPTD